MKKMNPRVKSVRAGDDYTLLLVFDNGEKKVFDVKPYLNFGVFKRLRDLKVFNAVKPLFGSVSWPKDIDIDPDTLYIESKKMYPSQRKEPIRAVAEPRAKYSKK